MQLTEELQQQYQASLKDFIKKGALSLGKLIKSCFKAAPGWLFTGLDFALIKWRPYAAMRIE